MDQPDRKLRHRNQRRRVPLAEGLEARNLLSASGVPHVTVVSATTADSRGVTVTYDVDAAAAGQAIKFQVFRGATAALDASDTPIAASQALPTTAVAPGTLDNAGNPATAAGQHTLTIALPGGLPPNPLNPNVLVAASDALDMSQGNTLSSASFPVYTVAVITHGGQQPHDWSAKGPPWERTMAAELLAEGYNAVIPYNWVAASGTPGAAVRQAPLVAADVVRAASAFPANAPVDVQFIGQGEGTVVNSQAILYLNAEGWPANAAAGYLKVTMLDPHAANNAFQSQQYSVSNGILGLVAKTTINAYQSKAHDPFPVVTSNVQDAEVFFQQTPVRLTAGSNDGIYNLWGQVPVQGQAQYYDLTAPGMSDAGKFGVEDWYRINVVPTLGTGGTFVAATAVTGQEIGTPTATASGNRVRVEYGGEAAPDVTVRLYGRAQNAPKTVLIGRTKSSANGSWTITTSPLVAGQYRVVVDTTSPHRSAGQKRPVFYHPIQWLGHLTINKPSGTDM